MKCPYCSYEESKVIDSRSADDGERIRRRRECLRCGKRFTTHEVIETVPIIVVKRDKSREVFDRNKLTGGILRACEKRPVSIEQIENMVNDIEAQLQSSLDREITSKQIGELAMDQLKNIDEVSYVRFASVYRQFKDINTFMDELNKLLTEKKFRYCAAFLGCTVFFCGVPQLSVRADSLQYQKHTMPERKYSDCFFNFK